MPGADPLNSQKLPKATLCDVTAQPFTRLSVHSAAGASASDCDFGLGATCGNRSYSSEWPGPGFLRIGEASHPGPPSTLCISCSNPSGLRGKEPLLLSLGPGIHAVAETHLSEATLPAVSGILSRHAHRSNRLVRSLAGSPVALRHSSTWAGTWSGVLTASDFPCHSLDISWPLEIWETGRVQLTSHQVGPHRILVATIYGYARGPTWPRARELTEQMLTHLTEHLVVGYSGMAIVGDFNPHELHEFDWRTYGWEHAQQLSHQRALPSSPLAKGLRNAT